MLCRILCLLLLSLVTTACAQEGWDEVQVGDEVVVTPKKKNRQAQDGRVEEKSDDELKIKMRFGSMSFDRDDIASVKRKGAAEVPAEKVSVAYGDGQSIELEIGQKVDLVMGRKTREVEFLGVEGDEMLVKVLGANLQYALADIDEIKVGGSGGAEGDPEGGDEEVEDVPVVRLSKSDPWPPKVGDQIKLRHKDDPETLLRATVLEVDAEAETLKVDTTELGELDLTRDEIDVWVTVGRAISHLQLARLIRHYGAEVITDWAQRFMPKPGVSRARSEIVELVRLRNPGRVLKPSALPIDPVGDNKEPSFELDALRDMISFQRERYLTLAEQSLDYFIDADLIESDEEKEVRRIFKELRRERPGKEAEVDITPIGTSIAKTLGAMDNEIRKLKRTRTPKDEIEAREAELDAHRQVQARLDDEIDNLALYRKLASAEKEDLLTSIKEQWDSAYITMRDTLALPTSGMRDEVESIEMPRPWVATIDLTKEGYEKLTKSIAELEAGSENVPFAAHQPYEADAWSFHRGLRQLPCTILPRRSAYKLRVGSSGTDAGHAALYHLNVYRFEDAEVCRLAFVRVEPGLHIRILDHGGKLLFCDAEEWIFR